MQPCHAALPIVGIILFSVALVSTLGVDQNRMAPPLVEQVARNARADASMPQHIKLPLSGELQLPPRDGALQFDGALIIRETPDRFSDDSVTENAIGHDE